MEKLPTGEFPWNEEQCTLFTNKVGRDIDEEEMQGIVAILVEKGFFDRNTYKEQQVLTSLEIQKVWLEATKRRKRDLPSLPYFMEELKVKNEKAKEEEEEGVTKNHNYRKSRATASK